MNSNTLLKSISIIIILLLTWSSSCAITSAEQNEVKLKIVPSTSFINAFNMAPGDSVTSNIIIQNKVNKDLAVVNIKTRIQSGSELLFNNLDLKVNEGSDTLFEGKLKGFQDLLINSVTENGKKLTFTITLPKNSLNELQGQKVMIAFDFITKYGEIINPIQNGSLPETATNRFNFIMIGIILLTGGCILMTIQMRQRK